MEDSNRLSVEEVAKILGVPALSNSPTLQQLWDALGSKLIEASHGSLPEYQRPTDSSPPKDVLAFILALSQLIDNKKGNCLTKNSPKSQHQQEASVVSYQCKDEMMTLQDALVAYKTYARSEGKSPSTIIWITSSVGHFADFLGPERQDIASITGNDLRRFIIALQEKRHKWSNHPCIKPQQAKLSPHTILNYARAIRLFFSFLYREGFIEANPMEKVKMPKVPDTVVPTLSLKEVEKLLAQPNKHSNQGFRDYAIMLTFYDTAIRLSELAGLKTDDIDYEQNLFIVMGKGNRQRYVPFGRRIAKVLMKYQLKHRPEPIGTDNFFLRHDGQPLLVHRIRTLVRMYGKKAGLRCYPHKLRHTSAVMFLRDGGDIFSLQKKLGHKKLDMTRRYSNLADGDVRDSHLKHSPGDRLRL